MLTIQSPARVPYCAGLCPTQRQVTFYTNPFHCWLTASVTEALTLRRTPLEVTVIIIIAEVIFRDILCCTRQSQTNNPHYYLIYINTILKCMTLCQMRSHLTTNCSQSFCTMCCQENSCPQLAKQYTACRMWFTYFCKIIRVFVDLFEHNWIV